jgi:quinol monooxygenase YgiN
MKNLTVVANFQAKPGKEAELKQILIGLIAPTRKEAGCISYDLHQSPEDPAKFLFYETWASKAQLDVHLANAQIQALLPRVGELCTGFPDIVVWDKIS